MTEQSKPIEQSTPTEQTEQTELLPLSSFYKVVDSITIFKSKKWWEAIVIIESYGRRSIAMYLWQNANGKWKRKHKFQIRNQQEWENVKNAVDKLAPKLFGESPKPQAQ
jgi:hypothetical protein